MKNAFLKVFRLMYFPAVYRSLSHGHASCSIEGSSCCDHHSLDSKF